MCTAALNEPLKATPTVAETLKRCKELLAVLSKGIADDKALLETLRKGRAR